VVRVQHHRWAHWANRTTHEIEQRHQELEALYKGDEEIYQHLGWSFFMTNLKALLEHGVDLREFDPDRAYASRAITH
jgi:hypothetical protein